MELDQGKEVNENNLRAYRERGEMEGLRENRGSVDIQEVSRGRRAGKKACLDEESEGGKLESEDLGLSLSSVSFTGCAILPAKIAQPVN